MGAPAFPAPAFPAPFRDAFLKAFDAPDRLLPMIPQELFDKIRRIEIQTRGLVNNVFGGEYQSAFRGRGMEFAEVRPYQIGDDVRNIDWNVSARMQDTYVKVFEEEREQTLMLLVDVSASGDFGSQAKSKREIAAEICALVAFSAVQNGDKAGMLLFSEEAEQFVPPRKGRRHVLRLIRDLFTHEPAARGTDLTAAFRYTLRVLQRQAVVLVISDFFDEGYEQMLRALAHRHDTVAVHLQDPREEELPDVGLVDLTDAETGETRVIDTRSQEARRAFSERAYQRQRRVRDLLRRAQVGHIPVRTDKDYLDPLLRFFRRRNRIG
jgi:uncharacterized protein (DUF58 family)